MPRKLAVFDFDHTIINDNSDTAVMKLIDHIEIPQEIKKLHKSDGWTAFMQGIFEAHNLKDNILKVFTNPAHFENNLLKIQMYHLQDTCKLSTKNLCKGQIMEDFVEEQKQNSVLYDIIIYCGDGFNDFCPILRLTSKDIACVRENYKCAEIVRKAKEGQYIDTQGIPRVVEANVCIWNNGFEIIDFIKQHIL